MSTPNKRVIYKSVPKGFPVPGETTVLDTSSSLDLKSAPLNGGMLLKILYLSVDPYMRGKMRDPNVKSYSPSYQFDKPIDGGGVARVLRSEESKAPDGSIVIGLLPFQEYAILQWSDLQVARVIENSVGIPLHNYISYAGMPGKTAYHGWRKYIEPKAKSGQTLYVSTAAGPVGSVLVQIAKKHGMKVIGSTGSDEKMAYLKTLGVDVAINYKKDNLREILEKEGPIHFYWDHVGGDTLNAALENMELFGTIIICGLIDGYNSGHNPLKSYSHILFKRLTVVGHMVYDLEAEYAEDFYKTIPKQIASGELKLLEHEYKGGLEDAGQAILDVQKGNNKGKAYLTVAKE